MGPGRVSTELDACLSFHTHPSVTKAKAITADYAKRGVNKDHVLIKSAATWEGFRGTETLQGDGIDCNLTVLVSVSQAIAGVDGDTPAKDPQVMSVQRIYDYDKSNGIATIIKGALFCNTGQIKAIAGCDNQTIAPTLLDALSQDESPLRRVLSPQAASEVPASAMDEATFRWDMNADVMAWDMLAQGIRKFDVDHRSLIKMTNEMLLSS